MTKVKVATFLDEETFETVKDFCDRNERTYVWFLRKCIKLALDKIEEDGEESFHAAVL